MLSIIIPAYNEEKYLNRTIGNIFSTVKGEGEVEVIVILNGYEQEVDSRAVIFRYKENMGERVAMNTAARMARGDFLLRIDAHCDFSPGGWDVMMTEVTGERDITVAVLTALDKETWERKKGHWYGFCQLMPNMEAKWLKPNRDKGLYKTIEPNMAFTGCGFCLRKDFYWFLGGADETLPKMGAIGEEFAVKAWLSGGKVQTRTDVMIGHIFGTGGYDDLGVKMALQGLVDRYGSRYDEITGKFPPVDSTLKLRPTGNVSQKRTVIVDRHDTSETKDDGTGRLIMKKVEHFRYVWVDDGSGMTEEQVREKFAPLAHKIGEEQWVGNDKGELVKVA